MAGRPKDEISSISIEDRRAIASAIVAGLINPIGLRFNPIATEGGDYNQGDGPYTQSGGGNHSQTGGGYTQSSLIRDNYLDIRQLGNILRDVRESQ